MDFLLSSARALPMLQNFLEMPHLKGENMKDNLYIGPYGNAILKRSVGREIACIIAKHMSAITGKPYFVCQNIIWNFEVTPAPETIYFSTPTDGFLKGKQVLKNRSIGNF